VSFKPSVEYAERHKLALYAECHCAECPYAGLPFRPIDPEGRSEDVDGGPAFVPLDLRLGFDGAVSQPDLQSISLTFTRVFYSRS